MGEGFQLDERTIALHAVQIGELDLASRQHRTGGREQIAKTERYIGDPLVDERRERLLGVGCDTTDLVDDQ